MDGVSRVLGKKDVKKDNADTYVGWVTEGLAANDEKFARGKMMELIKEIDDDNAFLKTPGLQPNDTDYKNGKYRSINEVKQEKFAYQKALNGIGQKFKTHDEAKVLLKNSQLLDNPTSQKKSGTPKGKGEGTSTSGSPQIIIYGGIAPNMVINSVDGSLPANQLKEKVGKVFLELINDVNLRTK
jgi:hypothetical protein